jgi:hypothetical protein
MSKVFVVFSITLLFSFYSNAQSKLQYKPQMIMHRVDDTTKGASGWYYAKSTGGNFSVSLPARFSDYTIQEAKAKKAKKIAQMYVVGGSNPEGILFSVTKMPMVKNESFETLVNEMTSSSSPAGTASDVKKEKYQNHNSISVTTTKDSTGGFTKFIELENKYVIVQSIVFMTANKKEAAAYADRFFSSLKILGK